MNVPIIHKFIKIHLKEEAAIRSISLTKKKGTK